MNNYLGGFVAIRAAIYVPNLPHKYTLDGLIQLNFMLPDVRKSRITYKV